MSDNEFGFTKFEAPVKSNPFTEVIQALADAGENTAYPHTTTVANAGKDRVKIGEAARAIGKTARLRNTTPVDADGNIIGEPGDTVVMTFTLTDLRKSGPRKRKNVAAE